MFLRAKPRFTAGKAHRDFRLVEKRRTRGNRVVQRQGLYLGERNDSQRAAWCRRLAALHEGEEQRRPMALFPDDRTAPVLDGDVVQINLSALQFHRPRPWGACWLACQLWEQLDLDSSWAEQLRPSRQGTRWLNAFTPLVCYRLSDPGSEWRLPRPGYERRAMADLRGEDEGLVQIDKLYRCLDKGLPHQRAFFSCLRHRW